MGKAKTGSGKTAAFALPILEKLSQDPFGIFAIVLTPTRLVNEVVSDITCYHALILSGSSHFKLLNNLTHMDCKWD